MRYRGVAVIVFILCIFTSCSNNQKEVTTVRQSVEDYQETKYTVQNPITLKVDIKNANLSIISWEKKEIDIEVKKHASGFFNSEFLKKCIKNNEAKISMKDNLLSINNYLVDDKNVDIKTDITIYSPAEFKGIDILINDGIFKSDGDLKGNGKINLVNGKIEIGRFTGAIDLKVVDGDISLQSGNLKDKSSFEAVKGNINVKADAVAKKEYTFSSENGHISILLPSKVSPTVNTVGIVKSNDFKLKTTDGPIINAKSKYGTIDIKKF